jgi:hypothetical protein
MDSGLKNEARGRRPCLWEERSRKKHVRLWGQSYCPLGRTLKLGATAYWMNYCVLKRVPD